ncbi:hypothetical protein CRP01_12500 [Flavilitoribacter nigricans DSM 23189 = NBRC 102662]|uniref:Uncharacterized protein n=1 Tax=Flavilitoribacter nigricans (strain ATCC 23147 / DSM 23189 / NBRC 102662 / NCIMB 1420 / SS-2) TaxID=1122177 RepID=A0A2D0NF22_FLAN2|nr:hypothetical protein CRP01_12500 [Flavilitoribacter nigricans DSM 23189 = NBRC 102662]
MEDLRIAKKELAIKKKLSKREFASHIGTLRHDATGYVIKRVVLPLGVGAVAALAIKFIFFDKNRDDTAAQDRKDQKEETEQVKDNVEKNTWLSYFSILLSIIKIYQTAVAQNKAEEAMESNQENTVAEDPAAEHPSANATAASEEHLAEEEMEDKEEIEPISPKSFVHNYRQQKAK